MTVLVVEDDLDVREAVVEVLESGGYAVAEATNGREALTSAAVSRPALILLDLMMPVMNGWQVLEALRCDNALSSIPVVVMTAHDQLPHGAVILRKPFTLDDLLTTVDRLAAPSECSGGSPAAPG